MLPGVRSPPQRIAPMPDEPPAMKPAMVAVAVVEGKSRSSSPLSRAAAYIVFMMAPGWATRRPGSSVRISVMWRMCSRTPPASGMA